MPSLLCLTCLLLRFLHDGYLSFRVYHRVWRFFLYHSWSCPSCFAYANIVHPVSVYLHYTSSQLPGLMHGAYIPAAYSDLFLWRQKLYPQDVDYRLRLGLANTCRWSDCSDYVVPSATALVSGVGFCNIWIFKAVGLLPLSPTPSLEDQGVYFCLTPCPGPVYPGKTCRGYKGPLWHTIKGFLMPRKLSTNDMV